MFLKYAKYCVIVPKSVVWKRPIHIEAKILSLGLKLPQMPPIPKGNYMNYSIQPGSGKTKIVHLAGHLPQPVDGPLMQGRLGENLTLEEGKLATRLAGMQMLATLQAACSGNLDRVVKVHKITGYVSSTNTFYDQAQVMNGCSDMLGEVFGLEVGRHCRSSLGVNVLPLGIPVEVDGVFEIQSD
eukprot:gene9059-12219_t